jgi:hypothetical protein
MSREIAHKVIVPQKKIRSQSFLNSGTLVFLCTRVLLCTVVVCCCLLLGVLVCCCVLEGSGGLLVAMLCQQVFRGRGLVGGRAPTPTIVCRYSWMLAGGWGGGCHSYIRFEEKHSTDEV